MGLSLRGRFTMKGKGQPAAIAKCDSSGIMGMYTDMVKQYMRAGQDLVWTGQWVLSKFRDKPAGSFIPEFKLDPVPLEHVRPDRDIGGQNTIATSKGAISLDVTGLESIILTPEQFNNGQITFYGVLTSNIVIYCPNTGNQLYIKNITTGDYTLGLQLQDNPMNPLIIAKTEIPESNGTQVLNNLFTLQIVYF